jgi:hypothetical protein
MQKKNLIRFVQSLVLLPVISTSFSNGSLQNTAPQNLLAKINIETSGSAVINPDANLEELTLEAKAKAVDAYFASRNMPLAGTGRAMVAEAEKNGLDWRLVAAIAVRESTGGKFACKKAPYNPFGWGSCKIGFKSNEHAIEVVARNLGGNNPNTARHYADKDTKAILQAYNPPSIVPRYADQVISIMNTIGPEDLAVNNAKNKEDNS